ncbi:MAG: glycoside hydrolase family 3 C-terminal domain-containing protein [Bacteroidales bacterium]
MHLKIVFPLILCLAACSGPQQVYEYPFRNPNLQVDERVADLISRLTLEEKASLMLYNAAPVERLGIPAYNWWNEALHGVARAGRATVFPQAIGMAAAFDEEMVLRVATAISDEGRAKYNEAVRGGNRGQYLGLTYWTPNINIFRDPRWGRGQETWGEDPFLTGRMGLAFVKGLQGDDPRYLKTAAAAKHFAVHSGPEATRHEFNAVASDYDLYNTYLPAFKTLVDGGVAGVMCAYNRLDGEACCASPALLTDILRNRWGFKGYIVTDCWALQDMITHHKMVSSAAEAAAMAVKNSVNINCGVVYRRIPEAFVNGLITEAELDTALAGGLKILFRLGWFDEEDTTPWKNLGDKDVATDAAKALARETAAKSMVLLKNNGVLPLKKDIRNIYVTGPNAAAMEPLWSNYHGLSGELVTLLEGITAKVSPHTIVNYNQGCGIIGDTIFRGTWLIDDSEVVVAVMGLNSLIEGEAGDAWMSDYGGDRKDIGLPANQVKYIKRLAESGKPVVVVVMAGSAVSLREIEPFADAILYAWYPGEQGGNAVADVLFADVNPAGRLPVTIYKSAADLPPFDDYSMSGRTYRYFDGEPEYHFGYGLSYTSFEYSGLKTREYETGSSGTIHLEVTVKNSGPADGDEVVQIYYRHQNPPESKALKSLIAFRRVFIPAGSSHTIEFEIPVSRLEHYSEHTRQYEIFPGEYLFIAGGSSADESLKTEIAILSVCEIGDRQP